MRAALILLVILLGTSAIIWTARTPREGAALAQAKVLPAEDPVTRGKYLVTISGCSDCHSPHDQNGPIKGREFSGHPEGAPLPTWDPSMLQKGALVTMPPTLTAFAGPFGVVVAPNLTPDEETGMGVLSVDGLIKSWRTGTHWKYPRPIMPPMPAEAYKEMKEEDIRAIYAFLRTLPPVKNKTPESVINMPMPPEASGAKPAPAGAH